MRRMRREGTKVWHNPELDTYARRRGQNNGAKVVTDSASDRRAAKEHRAALEALFAPRQRQSADAEAAEGSAPARERRDGGTPKPGRIVLTPPPQSDPKAVERQRLLAKLLAAAGRPNITKAANEFLRAGFTFPDEQDVYLQLLEHNDESHVRDAIGALDSILAGELPKRRAVLESRLRRIEEFADEPATRSAAERLRRRVNGRPDSTAP
jgi:hypothetical protein